MPTKGKTTTKAPAKKAVAKKQVEPKITPDWFTKFIDQALTSAESVDHPETLSENLPELIEILKAIKETPFSKVESRFGALVRSVSTSRDEKLKLETEVKDLTESRARLEGAQEALKEEIKSSKGQIAETRDEAEAIYTERLASLEEYETVIKGKDEAASRKLEAIERLNRETKNKEVAIQKEATEVAIKRTENENYLRVIDTQIAAQKRQEAALNLAIAQGRANENILAENKHEITLKVSELDAKREELIAKEAGLLRTFGEQRTRLAKLREEEVGIKRRRLDVDMMNKQAVKTLADAKGLEGAVRSMEKRLEQKYGVSGVVDFVKEKGNLAAENEQLKAVARAYQIMISQAKKKGWSDGEIDIPVFQILGENEFVKKLREQA